MHRWLPLEEDECNLKSSLAVIEMGLVMTKPFNGIDGTVLYFKQHEMNQNLGVWK